MMVLVGLLAVFLGLVIKSDLLVGFGVAATILYIALGYLHKKPVAQAAAKPRPRHKLINAPENAWEQQEDEIWKAMQSGPAPMMITGGTDFLGNVATGGFRDPHVAAAMRNMLPFPNYANQGPMGAIENLFFGLPFPIGKYIRGK